MTGDREYAVAAVPGHGSCNLPHRRGTRRQSLIHGKHRQLQSAEDADLAVDVGEVALDRVLRDRELTGNFPVAVTTYDGLDDFQFALRQPELVGVHRTPMPALREIVRRPASGPALAGRDS